VLENLTLSGRHLFPNIVSFEADNFVKFSPYEAIKDESHHEFTFTFAQIQADMKDIAFYFKKKTGLPKLSDSGLADVVLGGHGLTVCAAPSAVRLLISLTRSRCISLLPIRTRPRYLKSRMFT
jgi:hypothetical protein